MAERNSSVCQSDFLLAMVDTNVQCSPNFDEKALAAYRNNLYACAIRALQISYPTTLQLCGDDFFQELALDFLRRCPFSQGDWGEWGEEFAPFIASTSAAADYPYFSEVAGLDWLVHQVERASDYGVNAASFSLLNTEEAGECQLILSPLVRRLKSRYPIVDIFHAHHEQDADARNFYMSLAKEKIANNVGQVALVYRPIFKAYVEDCSQMQCLLLERIEQGDNLEKLMASSADTENFKSETVNAEVLNREAGESDAFEFETWLAESVEKKIVLGVRQ